MGHEVNESFEEDACGSVCECRIDEESSLCLSSTSIMNLTNQQGEQYTAFLRVIA